MRTPKSRRRGGKRGTGRRKVHVACHKSPKVVHVDHDRTGWRWQRRFDEGSNLFRADRDRSPGVEHRVATADLASWAAWTVRRSEDRVENTTTLWIAAGFDKPVGSIDAMRDGRDNAADGMAMGSIRMSSGKGEEEGAVRDGAMKRNAHPDTELYCADRHLSARKHHTDDREEIEVGAARALDVLHQSDRKATEGEDVAEQCEAREDLGHDEALWVRGEVTWSGKKEECYTRDLGPCDRAAFPMVAWKGADDHPWRCVCLSWWRWMRVVVDLLVLDVLVRVVERGDRSLSDASACCECGQTRIERGNEHARTNHFEKRGSNGSIKP